MRATFALPLIALLTACAAGQGGNAGESTPVRMLYSGNHCGAAQPSAALFPNRAAARAAAADGPVHEALANAPAETTYVRISMGDRRTGGYAVDPRAGASHREGEGLVVVAGWQTPAPDAMVTQVLTRPCAWLAVPGPTPATVTVIDTDGVTRAATTTR